MVSGSAKCRSAVRRRTKGHMQYIYTAQIAKHTHSGLDSRTRLAQPAPELRETSDLPCAEFAAMRTSLSVEILAGRWIEEHKIEKRASTLPNGHLNVDAAPLYLEVQLQRKDLFRSNRNYEPSVILRLPQGQDSIQTLLYNPTEKVYNPDAALSGCVL